MSPDDPLIDIHCHRVADGVVQILSLDSHELGAHHKTLIAGFDESKPQNETRALSAVRYFSLGLHPWFIERQNISLAMQNLDAIIRNPKLLAIGECGLDKCIATPLALQTEVFARQVELAGRTGKPLIIHCVKAFNELMQIKKSQPYDTPWIIHGFAGKPELARQLLRCGCYLSYGAALSSPRSHAGRALLETPPDRMFLETDTSDLPIGDIYATAAKMLQIGAATLRRQIQNNFERVFLQ